MPNRIFLIYEAEAKAWKAGKEESKIEMAKALKQQNISVDAIVKASGPSIEEIEKL